MNPTNKIKLFLVDDDALFLKSLEINFLNMVIFLLEPIPQANFAWPICPTIQM